MTTFLKTFNRRYIMAGGTAFGLLRASTVSAQLSTQKRNLGSGVKVTVTLDGMTYQYPGGPTIPSYYVTPYDDGRVVFHLGAHEIRGGSSVPAKLYHLGPHQVQIEREGTVVFNATIPAHYWYAEWTYRPSPIAPKKSPTEIVAANRMFPFGDTGCKYGAVTVKPYTIMGGASVTPYMPTTGERPDIGLLTDWSAWYMLRGDAVPMIETAKASGSFPFHYRDESTGKPIDLLKYPEANTNDMPGWGVPWIQRYPLNANGSAIIGGGLYPQQAHFPEMSYLAYCATQDDGFLEELQYAANYTTLCDAAVSHVQNKAIPSGEYRGLAWAFRNLFMAHAATRDAEAAGTLPAACHPSSYWKKLLDQALAYYAKFMHDPANQVFRMLGGPGRFGGWQVDFSLLAMAFGVLTGHDDWTPLYLWALKNAIDRTSNKSGFPPGYGCPYYMDGTKPDWYSAFLAMSPPDSNPPTPAEIARLTADPLNGGKAMYLNEAMMTTRAVLVMADYLDKKKLANVRVAYPDFDTCLINANRMFRAYGSVNARASVVDG